jgi:tRNA pseudouridine38-40 synthase
MRTFKLTLEYDGTDFNGWQIQANAERTVQAVLEKALSKIFKKKRVVVIGSGRTDKGVHARGQVAHFRVQTLMPPKEILPALNYNLPYDLAVVKVEEVGADFHAQFSARSKTYSYTIVNRSFQSPLERRTSLFLPRKISLKRLRDEAALLVGKHDFTSFANVDLSRTCDAVRTIHRLEIRKRKDHIVITIEADGFLYKMVRNIVGTLLGVAAGRFAPGSVKKMLKAKDRRAAGMAVLPQGLCLEEVKY